MSQCPCCGSACGADQGHARGAVPEITEEQRGLSGSEVAADSKSKEAKQIKTMVAQDARAARVLKKLEGALRKYKLSMVCKMAIELMEILENRGFEQAAIDCCLTSHVPHLCKCFPVESCFGSLPEGNS